MSRRKKRNRNNRTTKKKIRKAKDEYVKPMTKAPKQQECVDIINDINSRIINLLSLKTTPYSDSKKVDNDVNELKKDKKAIEPELRRLQSNAKSQSKLRSKKRDIIKKFNKLHPEQMTFACKESPGRPEVERYCPGLGAVLQDIVNAFCMTDPRRRSEMLHCITTLDHFHQKFMERGFVLSSSATYLRFQPHDSSTNQG